MRFLLSIVLCVIIAFTLGFWLSIPANPEVKFWQYVVELRDAEITRVRKEKPGQPILFFTGGSSCAFSIDPKIIEKTCQLPAFNLGLPIAAGPEYLIYQALERTKPGDHLVICLEPDCLSSVHSEPSPSKFSFAMASMAGETTKAGGSEIMGRPLGVRDFLNLTRPGAGYLATYLARLFTGKHYRYTFEDLRYRGRVETQLRAAIPGTGASSKGLSPYGEKLLRTMLVEAKLKGVTIAYSMPWYFVDQEFIPQARLGREILIDEIRTILPVIDDGYSGVASESDWFSDSPQHLTAAGSTARSSALANEIRNWLTPAN